MERALTVFDVDGYPEGLGKRARGLQTAIWGVDDTMGVRAVSVRQGGHRDATDGQRLVGGQDSQYGDENIAVGRSFSGKDRKYWHNSSAWV